MESDTFYEDFFRGGGGYLTRLLYFFFGLSNKHFHSVCVFSTLGNVQYVGGCSVHWRDTMSTSGGIS